MGGELISQDLHSSSRGARSGSHWGRGVGKGITQRDIYSTQLDHELDSLKVTVIFTKAQMFYVRKKLHSIKKPEETRNFPSNVISDSTSKYNSTASQGSQVRNSDGFCL